MHKIYVVFTRVRVADVQSWSRQLASGTQWPCDQQLDCPQLLVESLRVSGEVLLSTCPLYPESGFILSAIDCDCIVEARQAYSSSSPPNFVL